MAASYNEFKKKYLGYRVDVDGFPQNQPYQCWDLVSGVYFPYIGGHKISCTLTRYVPDIAKQKKTNGILNFCDDIGLHTIMQPGDICIWGKCAACPDGHIAIYDSDKGQDCVYFLGQNQPSAKVTIARIPVQGIIGVFRPKVFVKKPVVKPEKKPDQILTVGSKVMSHGFYVEKIDYQKDRFWNSWVGGWIACKDVVEVDARDGRRDQILHIGSGVAFPGEMTVTSVNVKNQTVKVKELPGYNLKSRCLYETKNGK